ncbi:UDP-glucosyltransferase 2-like [Athalia rosae]|uniref:UDP-glucosyltransferase 2-like n=1 Tax=Athalia rosae TaxID=37344 RepID=UPI0020335614|nr:UDP-glucosyltransferase 2-like [Athalia rosae]
MRFLKCSLFVIFASTFLSIEGYRILGVIPFSGTSHFVMFERLMRILAERGHHVDVMSPISMKNPPPNYRHVVNWEGSVPVIRNNVSYDFAVRELGGKSLVHTVATTFGTDLCDLMGLPNFQEFIKNLPKNPPYDLAIIEYFGSPCYLALGKYLGVPVIAFTTSPMWPWANDAVANPDNPAYIANTYSGLFGSLNFWKRVKNTLSLTQNKWLFNYYTAGQDDKIKKYLGPKAGSLEEARTNLSLVLVNSHYSLQGVRPFTTNVIEVGGLHIDDNGPPLQKDLQKWLDDSTDGFVCISFGSMLMLETFPREVLLGIYSSLAKLAPTRVLMKIVKPELLPDGLPSNVMTLPWIAQYSVLKHKNIRAFVTHGGLMGTQEAVQAGVPMIGVPIFGDQHQNMDLYTAKHVAVPLSLADFNEERLDAAFDLVLRDPSYAKAMKKLSAEFRDRPLNPVDTAIFWVEYVGRHGGEIIRSPAMDLTWWQISLIDVYGALILSAALILYLLKTMIARIIIAVKSATNGEKRTTKSKKNK